MSFAIRGENGGKKFLLYKSLKRDSNFTEEIHSLVWISKSQSKTLALLPLTEKRFGQKTFG
jgi:hypothetical protein